MARFGKIQQFLPNKCPQIENMFPQIVSFPSVKICLLLLDLEENGHIVTNLGYLHNKDMFFGGKLNVLWINTYIFLWKNIFFVEKFVL